MCHLALPLPAGHMKAPACGAADAQPRLSETAETTGLRIFRVQSSSSTTIFGVPLAITSAGRCRRSIVKAIVAWWNKRHAHQVLMVGWQEQARAKKNPDVPS